MSKHSRKSLRSAPCRSTFRLRQRMRDPGSTFSSSSNSSLACLSFHPDHQLLEGRRCVLLISVIPWGQKVQCWSCYSANSLTEQENLEGRRKPSRIAELDSWTYMHGVSVSVFIIPILEFYRFYASLKWTQETRLKELDWSYTHALRNAVQI